MRAIGYFRASDGHGSIQELEKAFAEFCDVNVHQAVKTFGDTNGADSSGFPQYENMLGYMKDSGSTFLIVVPDAGHLGKDLESVARTLVQLEGLGAKVTCDDDNLPDPLQNSFHTLGIKGVSRTRSERIKESMKARAMMGKGLGKPPFGFHNGADGALEIVKDEASIVELIYRLYIKDGLGLRLIAQHLNEREIKTRRGGQWNMVTIRDILKNSTYMGTYTRFGLRLSKSHEAIIPPKLFREAQDETRARRPTGRVSNSEPFLLSGLVYCGYCNNKMMGVTRRQTWRRKDGRRSRGVYRYYQCQSRNNQSLCEYHTWRAPLLEGTVLNQLKYALQARTGGNGDSHSSERKQEIREIWNTRVANAERRFLQAMRRAAKGEIRLEPIGEYLDDLEKVRRSAKNSENPVGAFETLAKWDSLEISERQSFLMEHVLRIVVKDDAADVLV